jgi:hypothetical protein
MITAFYDEKNKLAMVVFGRQSGLQQALLKHLCCFLSYSQLTYPVQLRSLCSYCCTFFTTLDEQGVKLLGLLLAGSTGQHMAGRNGLA